MSLPENVEFSAGSDDLVDIEDVLLGNSEYSVRIMGFISFILQLLHTARRRCGVL